MGEVVRVTRSGGFTGRTTVGEVDLSGDGDRAGEARALVERLAPAPRHGVRRPVPDAVGYRVELPDGRVWELAAHELTPDLRALVDLVLEPSDPIA